MNDLIALLDMDGTIADLDSALERGLAKLAAPGEEPPPPYSPTNTDPPHIDARKTLLKRQPGFWRNLPPLQLGFDIVKMLVALKFEVHVLTKGPQNTTSAWTEKVDWVHQWLPGTPVTITRDKSLVYGRVLVDDWPPYFEAWLKVRPRGLVICIAHPWNEAIDDPRVIRYDGTNLDQVRDALLYAKNRPAGPQPPERDE